MDDAPCGNEHRKALLSFIHCYTRKRISMTILSLLLGTLLVLGEVQSCYTIEGTENRQFVALFLAMHHQNQGVHAIVFTSRKVLWP